MAVSAASVVGFVSFVRGSSRDTCQTLIFILVWDGDLRLLLHLLLPQLLRFLRQHLRLRPKMRRMAVCDEGCRKARRLPVCD